MFPDVYVFDFFFLFFQAKRKLELELELDIANEGFKTPAKTCKKQRTKLDGSPKGE